MSCALQVTGDTLTSSLRIIGDSGGSLFLERKKRYFQVSESGWFYHKRLHITGFNMGNFSRSPCHLQVGVVSWGTVDVCSDAGMGRFSSDRPHPDARDLHIDVFKIIPWLRKHLGDIQFLPVDD